MKLRDLLKGKPAHPPMPEWRPLEELDELDGQCTVTTRAGKRCALPATRGTGRCAVHLKT